MSKGGPLASLGIELFANIADFVSDLGRADAEAKRASKKIQDEFQKMGVGIAAGFAVGAAGLEELTRTAIDTADKVNKLSQRVGLTVGAFSQLSYAAELSDVSMDDFAGTTEKLSKNIIEAIRGSEEQAEAFRQMGVATADTTGHSRELLDVILDLADKFKSYKDGPEKIRLAYAALGKQGTSLIPLLNQGSDAIRAQMAEAKALGYDFTKTAAQAEEFKDGVTKLGKAAVGLGNDIATELLPELNEAVKGMLDFVKAARADGTVQNFAHAVGEVAHNLEAIVVFFGTRAILSAGVAAFATLSSGAAAAGVALAGLRAGLALLGGPTGLLALGATALYLWDKAARAAKDGSDELRAAEVALTGVTKESFETSVYEAGKLRDLAAMKIRVAQATLIQLEAEQEAAKQRDRERRGTGLFARTGNAEPVNAGHAVDEQRSAIERLKQNLATIEGDIAKTKDQFEGLGKAAAGTVPPIMRSADAIKAEAKWFDYLNDRMVRLGNEAEQFRDQITKQNAELSGPLSIAQAQFERGMDTNRHLLASGAIELTEYNHNLEVLTDTRDKDRRAIEAQLTPYQQMMQDLAFEHSITAMSNIEREREIALRLTNVAAIGKEGDALQEAINQHHADEMARQASQAWLDTWASAVDDLGKLLDDVLGGQVKDLGKAIEDALGNIGSTFRKNAIGKITRPINDSIQNGTPLDMKQIGQGMFQAGSMAAGTAIGGGGQNASTGAAIGGAIGSIYGPVGTVVGSIIGGMIGGAFDKELSPSIRVGSANRPEATTPSIFGTVSVGTEDFKGGASQREIAGGIARFDAQFARLLDQDEVDRVRTAVQSINETFEGSAADLEGVLSSRLDHIIAAVEPKWTAFLSNFVNVQERVEQFSALRDLDKMVADFQHTVDSLDPAPLSQLRFQLHNLQEAVDKTATELANSIAAADPKRILEAANAAQQAAIRRFQGEVDAIRNLQAAIDQLNDSATSFRANIASRLFDVGGGDGGAASLIHGAIADRRGEVLNARDTATALTNLDRFVGTVDTWLETERARVQAWAQQAKESIQTQLEQLAAEQSAIMSAAQARQQDASAAADEAQRAAQEAHDSELQALQEQLDLANAWVDLMKDAQSFLDKITFGPDNPLSQFARSDLLDRRIDETRAQFSGATGAARTDLGKTLLDLLDQRLQGAQGLFDRPSPEYLEIFNRTAREAAELRDQAAAASAGAEDLQHRIAELQQQTVDSIQASSDLMDYLSSEERKHLDDIELQRTNLQTQLLRIDAAVHSQLEALNKEARGYYEWAQTTFEQLQQTRHQELIEQLDEITGGLDPESYIAARMTETVDLLTQIRDDVSGFLNGLSGAAVSGPNSGPIGDVGGDVGVPAKPPGTGSSVVVQFNPTINVTGGEDAGQQVMQIIYDNAPIVASIVKREFNAA